MNKLIYVNGILMLLALSGRANANGPLRRGTSVRVTGRVTGTTNFRPINGSAQTYTFHFGANDVRIVATRAAAAPGSTPSFESRVMLNPVGPNHWTGHASANGTDSSRATTLELVRTAPGKLSVSFGMSGQRTNTFGPAGGTIGGDIWNHVLKAEISQPTD